MTERSERPLGEVVFGEDSITLRGCRVIGSFTPPTGIRLILIGCVIDGRKIPDAAERPAEGPAEGGNQTYLTDSAAVPSVPQEDTE